MKKAVIAAIVAAAVVAGAWLLLSSKPMAPNTTFALLNGEQVTVASLRGKVVLVNFWATSCPGCIKEMPSLVETQKNYRDRGFETVAVAMSYDTPAYVRTYTEKNALPFKVALDSSGANALAFGEVRLTPTSFLIDRQGHIVQRYLGEPDFAELHREIEHLLAAG
ncbi:MAG: peroxiredoxin family protein [Burkholderiales bacterium]|nr:TlpA family protein disulfide reductase [Sulfuricellaceae bacterium]